MLKEEVLVTKLFSSHQRSEMIKHKNDDNDDDDDEVDFRAKCQGCKCYQNWRCVDSIRGQPIW